MIVRLLELHKNVVFPEESGLLLIKLLRITLNIAVKNEFKCKKLLG